MRVAERVGFRICQKLFHASGTVRINTKKRVFTTMLTTCASFHPDGSTASLFSGQIVQSV